MRSRMLALALSIGLIPIAAAQSDGRGESIMFEKPSNNDYKELTTMPEQQTLGDRCMEMSREIESLKGKPQRRSALMERYRQECELR